MYYFLGVLYFDVGTKRPKIILNYNDYTMAKQLASKTYWLCTQYYKTRCKSRIITKDRMALVSNDHNHAPSCRNVDVQNMVSLEVTITKKKRCFNTNT